jgi:hypothetical protein
MDDARGAEFADGRNGAAGRSAAGTATGRFVVVCGLPGVGKTLVSERIADRLDGRVFRTDVIRKELYAEPAYTSDERESVYEELFSRARQRVRDGTDAVLDATFRARTDRNRVGALADAVDAPLDVVRVVCDEPVVRERIAARECDESDADFGVHLRFRDRFEPLERRHRTVDNSGSVESTRRQVDELF